MCSIMENYNHIISIEATTMVDMIRRDLLPAVSGYSTDLCERADSKAAAGIACKYEKTTAAEIAKLTDALLDDCDKMEADLAALPGNSEAAMEFCHKTLVPDMARARENADKLETMTAAEYWPFPVYSDLLFYM